MRVLGILMTATGFGLGVWYVVALFWPQVFVPWGGVAPDGGRLHELGQRLRWIGGGLVVLGPLCYALGALAGRQQTGDR